MPIITVQFIKDVVATPEQKRELVVKLTDTFVDILGEVVRPFVYCLIHETPQSEWAIAGVPMPDLAYLTSDKHAGVIARSNELMRQAIASAQGAPSESAAAPASANLEADRLWRGASAYGGAPSDAARSAPAKDADDRWRGGGASAGVAGQHRALFARWFEELWNKKNYDIAYELVDPGFIAHGAGGQDINQGPGGVIEMVKAWHKAMPDGHMTMDDIITEGELSTIRMTWRGTHTGPFGDVPASGNEITVTSIGIDRVENGKITEGWGELDMIGMLRQMGAMPGAERQGERAASGARDLRDPVRLGRNKEVVRRFYEAVNSQNTGAFYELVAADFVNHGGAAGDLVGPKALIDSLQPFLTAMPDWHVSEDYVVAEGDRVAARGTISGTHLGSFAGEAPTRKKVSWTGTIIYRLDDAGKIVERWQDFDALGMLTQFGIIPSAEQVAA